MMKKNDRTAYEAALFLLNRRAQSTWEVRSKLKKKGYDAEDIEDAVKRLLHFQYLDDEALAAAIFRHYQKEKLYGDAYIQRKLKLRGLSIARHLTEEEEEEKAALAFQKQAAITPKLRENYRKAAGFLLRRGFPASLIRSVLSRSMDRSETAWQEAPEGFFE